MVKEEVIADKNSNIEDVENVINIKKKLLRVRNYKFVRNNMSSKHSKNNKGPRSHWHPSQQPSESMGIAHNKKFNFWEVYHRHKNGKPDEVYQFTDEESANKKYQELLVKKVGL